MSVRVETLTFQPWPTSPGLPALVYQPWPANPDLLRRPAFRECARSKDANVLKMTEV